MRTVARVGRILRAVALLAVLPTLAVALLAEPEQALLLALVLVLQVLPVALASRVLGRPEPPGSPEEELLALEPVVLEARAPEEPPG